MQTVGSLDIFDRDIKEDASWSTGDSKELLMHRIHAYPAKFPAFLTPKIVGHLQREGKVINQIADIFCGCGTSALESKLLGIDYWGIDINPVATLIAKTKSQVYNDLLLEYYLERILAHVRKAIYQPAKRLLHHERLNYWFAPSTIVDLNRLLKAIHRFCPAGKHRNFFLTAFSNILKPCSFWLTKSIKPQIDPHKKPAQAITAFVAQVGNMRAANRELKGVLESRSKTEILTRSVLRIRPADSFVDLIISSPPYVTSYEYADLHQLSTLWLGFVEDYRDLRAGTIGSDYQNHENGREAILNPTGERICAQLIKVDKGKSRAVRNYFRDMDRTICQSNLLLNPGGSAAFLIGNTSYKDVTINNAKYLAESLFQNGFSQVKTVKRRITLKTLTPYRNSLGRFSTDGNGRKVYSHEYLIIGTK